MALFVEVCVGNECSGKYAQEASYATVIWFSPFSHSNPAVLPFRVGRGEGWPQNFQLVKSGSHFLPFNFSRRELFSLFNYTDFVYSAAVPTVMPKLKMITHFGPNPKYFEVKTSFFHLQFFSLSFIHVSTEVLLFSELFRSVFLGTTVGYNCKILQGCEKIRQRLPLRWIIKAALVQLLFCFILSCLTAFFLLFCSVFPLSLAPQQLNLVSQSIRDGDFTKRHAWIKVALLRHVAPTTLPKLLCACLPGYYSRGHFHEAFQLLSRNVQIIRKWPHIAVHAALISEAVKSVCCRWVRVATPSRLQETSTANFSLQVWCILRSKSAQCTFEPSGANCTELYRKCIGVSNAIISDTFYPKTLKGMPKFTFMRGVSHTRWSVSSVFTS